LPPRKTPINQYSHQNNNAAAPLSYTNKTNAPGAAARKLLQGWPEPPINVATPAGPLVIRRYPVSVQNIVGGNVFLPNPVLRGRGSGK
jgi:hypothetical protein